VENGVELRRILGAPQNHKAFHRERLSELVESVALRCSAPGARLRMTTKYSKKGNGGAEMKFFFDEGCL
jgi:hypothetical protein